MSTSATRAPLQTVHESVMSEHRVSYRFLPVFVLFFVQFCVSCDTCITPPTFTFQKDEKSNTRMSSSKSRTDEPHIGKYRLIKTIGKGNFAKVKLAKHVPTGREVCIFK